MDADTRHLLLTAGALALVSLIAVSPAPGQDANLCDVPGEVPDVIVGDLFGISDWGRVDDIHAFSFGTESCNIGTCWLNWFENSNAHPVIGQNMFRLRNGRFEQIGQSWLKHGFFAVSSSLCFNDCVATNGDHLGVHCSDPYTSVLNGIQNGLGPKFEVNPHTGIFPFPATDLNVVGDSVYKRLQVHGDDLDPALNLGAQYFVEGQYVTSDDSLAGNQNNNASYRPVEVIQLGENYDLQLIGVTQQQAPAIQAWADNDPSVAIDIADVTHDGRFLLASKAVDLGDGFWAYEYAVQNLNSHRSARSITVPIPPGAIVRNAGFHDVDYHSGEPFDGTDWTFFVFNDGVAPGRISWSSHTIEQNADANALRWGTLYNFRYEADVAPVRGEVALELFRAGEPAEVSGSVFIPEPCNTDGLCGLGEDCTNCPEDCVTANVLPGVCGDGLCEFAIGEDCLSCPDDCNGAQTGPQADRFCCSAGAGQNPVDCSDPRCSSGGQECGDTSTTNCCGDGTCDPGEDPCQCEADCGPCLAPCGTPAECDDGIFCNGAEDCVGGFCAAAGPACPGELCDEAADTCSECFNDGQCDDANFCNGLESCIAGACTLGTHPCPDDGLVCTGIEQCVDNACIPPQPVCPGQQCDEPTLTCFNCNIDAHCDDGLFCNGVESCDAPADTCLPGVGPCPTACDEPSDGCLECVADIDCSDGIFCNGIESCNAPGFCGPPLEPGCPGFCLEAETVCVGNAEPQPKPGEPLFRLGSAERLRFGAGQASFGTVHTEPMGLGPIYNDTSCAACHALPAGGSAAPVNTRFGLSDGQGGFDPLADLGGSLLQGQALSPSCLESLPPEANVSADRLAGSVLGAGLIEAIAESDIEAHALSPPAGVSGRVNRVPVLELGGSLRVGRFGWKAQQATVLSAAAGEARDQLGLTNRLLVDEDAPNGDVLLLAQCDSQSDPEDGPDGENLDFIDRVSDYQRYLAPPPQTPRSGMPGEVWLALSGCTDCHVPSFTTADDPALEPALRNRLIRPYSDFLLHDMGAEADGIGDGNAAETEMRTTPLWGLRNRPMLWHDGRVNDSAFDARVLAAIALHDSPGSEAQASAQSFFGQAQIGRDSVIALLESLGRVEFDMDADADVDGDDYPLFLACFTGPGSFYTPSDACAVADVDQDGDVDDDDLALFAVVADGVAGRVPDGASAPGPMLTVSKAGGSQLALSWGASCLPGDGDYGIYEGTIGLYPSHASLMCSTGGATQATVSPGAGGTYYLVAPQSDYKEGGSGVDSGGLARPQGLAACLPQSVGACP